MSTRQVKKRSANINRETTVTVLTSTGPSSTIVAPPTTSPNNGNSGSQMPNTEDFVMGSSAAQQHAVELFKLPPGQNDLEVLERLKIIIKSGQHEYYRAVPQPAALASMYLGPAPSVEEASKFTDHSFGAHDTATDEVKPIINDNEKRTGHSDQVVPARLSKYEPNAATNGTRSHLGPNEEPVSNGHSHGDDRRANGGPPQGSPAPGLPVTPSTSAPLPKDPTALAAELALRRQQYPEKDRERDERELQQRLREKARLKSRDQERDREREPTWAPRADDRYRDERARLADPRRLEERHYEPRYTSDYPVSRPEPPALDRPLGRDAYPDRRPAPDNRPPPPRAIDDRPRPVEPPRRVPAPIDRTVNPPIGVPPPPAPRSAADDRRPAETGRTPSLEERINQPPALSLQERLAQPPAPALPAARARQPSLEERMNQPPAAPRAAHPPASPAGSVASRGPASATSRPIEDRGRAPVDDRSHPPSFSPPRGRDYRDSVPPAGPNSYRPGEGDDRAYDRRPEAMDVDRAGPASYRRSPPPARYYPYEAPAADDRRYAAPQDRRWTAAEEQAYWDRERLRGDAPSGASASSRGATWDDRDRRPAYAAPPAASSYPPPPIDSRAAYARYPAEASAAFSSRVRPRSPSPLRRDDSRPPLKRPRDDYPAGYYSPQRRASGVDYRAPSPPPSSSASGYYSAPPRDYAYSSSGGGGYERPRSPPPARAPPAPPGSNVYRPTYNNTDDRRYSNMPPPR